MKTVLPLCTKIHDDCLEAKNDNIYQQWPQPCTLKLETRPKQDVVQEQLNRKYCWIQFDLELCHDFDQVDPQGYMGVLELFSNKM